MDAPDIIYARFVEAAAASGRPWHRRSAGPRGYGASWIDPSRLRATPSRFDINAMHEGEKLGTREVSDAPAPGPDAISRADEVICDWVPRYLVNLPNEATCLWAHAGAHVGWGSFRQFCRQNKISERTGRRRKAHALQAVVVGLGNDGVSVPLFSLDGVPHSDANTHSEGASSGPAFARMHEADHTFVPRTPAQVAAFEKQLARTNKRRRKLRKWQQRAGANA